MKFPTIIKAYGKIYQVSFCHITKRQQKNYGYTNFQEETIDIASDLKGTRKSEETLLHECMHIAEVSSGLDLPESTIVALSCGLYGILKDNGWWGNAS